MPEEALLVMDIQQGVVGRFGGDDDLLARLRRAIAGARQAGVLVVFVRVAFRPGYPEVPPPGDDPRKIPGLVRDPDETFVDGKPSAAVHTALEPRPEDVVVVKKRISAFVGSDLEVILRSHGIRRVALTGIGTSGVVLSTLTDAVDRDYEVTVLADGCADSDEVLHRTLIERLFPRRAGVATVDEWVRSRAS
jgi:nicotinamidase-related amidase